ncbi:MAG: hypothetical protein ACD_38C00146G0008 [uncultured bacterium]|uniref:Uncharacterized protein n=1 Tax=Candidatus Daviesbacteria bacterium GW2011_GWC2_40_12 TaxID=1618431 RepID=A0A0G0QWH7_9BACT|nr:MAG: hypothetical protein ACD_38C00146G0008 [uncultured bacterium]KKQ85237.1 MAG: hypothetical protein UT04_C0006G0008 [Candidatus Daviesbacteria bacterium GW2011_GWF2_38_7]KKR17500.1 MAG: hypothetical protein UT45_C0001G0175 [Candidatus Daviesbacteria bacterium GW2011_GWA2_39_33]KKR25015.1 MAG: hypothetical protein UT54_C0008G0010 [Candidatus Daviesbacteria bacterium GW2011_GWB1_39_5]KKR41706.1 MAG: hypothetical protein UT77_C0007G0008 [Candidatus Daviesbacteria bacterium GW2011_GWC2_40_12]
MLNGKSDSAKESYFDGKVTRHNLYLGKDTFLDFLKKYSFTVENFIEFRRGHTNYLIANAVDAREI